MPLPRPRDLLPQPHGPGSPVPGRCGGRTGRGPWAVPAPVPHNRRSRRSHGVTRQKTNGPGLCAETAVQWTVSVPYVLVSDVNRSGSPLSVVSEPTAGGPRRGAVEKWSSNNLIVEVCGPGEGAAGLPSGRLVARSGTRGPPVPKTPVSGERGARTLRAPPPPTTPNSSRSAPPRRPVLRRSRSSSRRPRPPCRCGPRSSPSPSCRTACTTRSTCS